MNTKKAKTRNSTNNDWENEGVIKVVNVGANSPSATRKYRQTISNFGSLGKEVKISPKACATKNEAGYSLKFLVPSISVIIGIGADHSAELVMDEAAWQALKKGKQIDITTVQEFKETIQ